MLEAAGGRSGDGASAAAEEYSASADEGGGSGYDNSDAEVATLMEE